MHDTNKIRQRRWVKGWSQQELADITGLSRNTISRIERGETSNPKTVNRIAQVLGVSMEDLIVNGH